MSSLLIVESPAKAKTITKYLGKDFVVLSSYGHVRGLPNRSNSVKPNEDFDMIYEILEKSKKAVDKIIKEIPGKKVIMVCTDPDREGEGIAWHLLQIFLDAHVLNDIPVFRVVFNEVTKKAVVAAINNPREINLNLVHAQRARQALDYLVGYTLSPILWRKLPGSRSAGRVQSVALKLICERENEIKKFISQEYWTINVNLKGKSRSTLMAILTHIDKKKLEKFDIKTVDQSAQISQDIKNKNFNIKDVIVKEIKRNPYPPFITSTLQQEMSSKHSFSAKKTMTLAQKLYEGIEIDGELRGLITYMRTDGLYIADDAIQDIRSIIGKKFGNKYLPSKINTYDKKVKNAQEAHEAIRPTNIALTPEKVENFLSKDEFKLYSLIWRRTVASQMNSAIYENLAIILSSDHEEYELKCSNSILKFDGFYKVYKDDDNYEEDKNNAKLNDPNKFEKGAIYSVTDVLEQQHFTEPPSRYTEASLIKKMEELGIGRPSTYASIISVIQDRGYANLVKKNFIPENRGIILSSFLNHFFTPYVEYNFTANLEDSLDLVSSGEQDWKALLKSFWDPFIENIKNVEKVEIPKVLEKISADIFPYLNVAANDSNDLQNKICTKCGKGNLTVNISKHGIFLGCSSYPECNYTESILSNLSDNIDVDIEVPKKIASNISGDDIFLNRGPYGFYLQHGTKKVSLAKNMKLDELTEDLALMIVTLPKNLGEYEEDIVKLGSGPYGFYILHKKKFYNVDMIFLNNATLEKAIEIIKSGGKSEKRIIGSDPSGEEISVQKGRYGFYIKYCGNNFAIPKGIDHQILDVNSAMEIINKSGKGNKKTPNKS